MVQFRYSNKDTKDEGRKESWSARDDPYTRCHAPAMASVKMIIFSYSNKGTVRLLW